MPFLAIAMLGCRSTARPGGELPPAAEVASDASVANEQERDDARAPMVGVVIARAVDLAPLLQGRLQNVGVRLGDHVDEGAVVAALDARITRLEVPKAHASLRATTLDAARAQVQVAQLHDRAERKQRLFDAALASADELATARFEEQAARVTADGLQAQREERGADLARARRTADETTIRAPFAGVVSRRYLDPGAAVGPGTPVVRLVSDDRSVVRFAAPEAAVRDLGVGTAVLVHAEGGAARARVERVAPEVDAASRTVFIEARLDAPDDIRLLANEIVHVTRPEGVP
jgi:RND family efflux transporter MFP subunit